MVVRRANVSFMKSPLVSGNRGVRVITRSGDLLASTVVCAVLVMVILLITATAGAVGIARSDDWSYLLTQFEFAESGQFVMNNWAVTMLIGQTLMASPVVMVFGSNITALQGFVAVLSLGALVTTYWVIRRVLPVGWSWFAVIALVVSPIFGPSAVSFMTDVPALLFLSVSLLLGIHALCAGGIQWLSLVFAGLVGIVAFSFRDYAIMGFVAVVLVGLVVVRRHRDRWALLGALLASVGLAAILYSWRHSLPNDLRLPGWDVGFSIQLVARGALTLALLVFPALAAVAWWRLDLGSGVRKVALWAAAEVAAVIVSIIADFEFLGNVIHPFGTTWLMSGVGIRMWPLWFNRFLLVLAATCLALIFVFVVWAVSRARGASTRAHAVRSFVRADIARAVIVAFPVLLLIAHASATLVLGTWLIDRYFILVLPFLTAAILVLARGANVVVNRTLLALPVVALAAYGVWGLYVVDFDARFDGARWAISEELVQSGYAPNQIDGGMQWVSFHATDIGLGAQDVPMRPGRNWWTERYPQQPVCVTVIAIDGRGPGSVADLPTLSVSTMFGRQYTLVATPGPDTCS